MICTDDYHRYDRKARAAAGLSALDPRANYVDILEQHLRLLRAGEPILKPVYDHRHGTFEPPEYVRPKEFVIAEGLLGYTTRTMRDCYDVKIYLDPQEELRVKWKMHRDTTNRGYSREEVLFQLGRREIDSREFHPSSAHFRRYRDPVPKGRPTPTAPTPGSMSGISCARRCPTPTSPRCSTARAMLGAPRAGPRPRRQACRRT